MEYNDSSTARLNGEENFVKGRSDSRNRNAFAVKNKHMSRFKIKDGKWLFWICGKEGHFKRQCYNWLERNKYQRYGQYKGEASLVKDDVKDLVGLLIS